MRMAALSSYPNATRTVVYHCASQSNPQMANTPREPTSTLPPPSRLPPVTTSSPFHTAPEPYRPVTSDHATSPTLQNPLKPSSPSNAKSYLTSKVELTGTAAMEEMRRHEDELKKQNALVTSPNPAKTLLSSSNEGISRPSDAPPALSSTSTSRRPDEPLPLTPQDQRTVVAEPMEIDDQDNDAPMTSTPERNSAPSDQSDPNHPSSSKKRPFSPSASKSEDRSNKSFTYPPPPDHEVIGGTRNMSLPNSGTKSPSVKKHRCPHCDTEFTRHHNLKSHLLTHSQEKPYGCDQCSQRFRRLHDLKRHVKLHTGERPHTCTICGRKFARGDALARHNKGPGGCAGRRESGAGDDDYSDLRGDEDMDDAYPPEDDEGDEHDPESDNRDRRRSEPNKRSRRGSGRQDSTASEYRQSSTYPPVAPALGTPRGAEMPPPTSAPPNRDGQHLSPWHAPPSFSSVQYNGPSSAYSHSGMTESPKPLSPGNSDPHRHNSDARPRSPSLATKLAQQHFGRSTDGNSRTPPISLPPPISSHQQLPGISGIDPRFGSGSGSQNTPQSNGRPQAISNQLGSSSSGPPSETSQHQSSGGSGGRDVHYLGQTSSQAPRQDESGLREYVRGLEMRLHEEKTARAADREERDKIIRQQQEELNNLRSDLTHLQGQQQQQQHRRSH